MKNAMLKSLYLSGALLAYCGQGAFAQVSMTLTGVNEGYVMGGVYTSPYSITANGTPMLLICDDFTFDIPSIPYAWTAGTTSFASLDGETTASTSVRFDQSSPTQQVADYATAAVLAAELMALPSYYSEAAGEYSYAIWGVFDPTLLTSNPASGVGSLTPGELSAAQGDLAAAKALVAGATNASGVVNLSSISIDGNPLEGLTIYTPLVPPGPNSQEFLSVSVAEPPSPALLGADLLALAGLILIARRRLASSVKLT
jgi:hypothetical protein